MFLLTESFDTSAVVNRVASKLRQELSKFHLYDSIHNPTQSVFRTDPLIFGKVVLRPDTTLDKKKVYDTHTHDVPDMKSPCTKWCEGSRCSLAALDQ